MSKRSRLRAQYIEGWETMDADKLVTATFAVRPELLPHKLYLPAIARLP